MLPNRGGGILGQTTDRRSLERERVSGPHKCIRTQGSLLCTEVIPPDSNQQSHLSETGQYHGSLVPKQVGGHSLPSTSPSSNNDLGWVRKDKSISSGTAYPRQDQCGSGYRVPGEAIALNKSGIHAGGSSIWGAQQGLFPRFLIVSSFPCVA